VNASRYIGHQQPSVVADLPISATGQRFSARRWGWIVGRVVVNQVIEFGHRPRCEPGQSGDERNHSPRRPRQVSGEPGHAHSSASPMKAAGRAREAPWVFRSIRIGPPRMRAPRPRRRYRPCSCNAFPRARSRDRPLWLVGVHHKCGERQVVVDTQRLEPHGRADADLVWVRIENRREQAWTLG
jgi:hypothetical protein